MGSGSRLMAILWLSSCAVPDQAPAVDPAAAVEDTEAADDEPTEAFAGRGTLHRLSAWEIENILADALGLSPGEPRLSGLAEDGGTPFGNDLDRPGPSLAFVEALEVMALELGSAVAQDPLWLDDLLACGSAEHDDDCLDRFVRRLGAQLWRQPLTTS